MNDFKKRYFLAVIICLLIAVKTNSQIKVSEFVQKSKIATPTNNKLYFVDFWATWCAPCITAKKHLGVLQKQFPSEFYVVSLTKENPLIIERFLKKNPTSLTVAIDYYGETFKEYNVKALPDGVLFNAEGKILWQGGAPDLKANVVSKFLKRETSKIALESFFKMMHITEEVTSEYVPTKALEIELLKQPLDELKVIENSSYIKLSGSLKEIISYLAKIYKNQIILDKSLNLNYEIYLKKPYNNKEDFVSKLIAEMNLKIERKLATGEGINFNVDDSKLWDTNQIDWGENNTKYLVGDSQMKADNVSLRDIAYQLSYVLDVPVILPENDELNTKLHDWDFHYKFFQLMQADLQDNYGIKAEKKKLSYPVYHIQKKAP